MANEKRLIDANALFAEAERIFCVNCNWYDGKCRECQYAEFADMLVEAPTVDAVEVVHGKWLNAQVETGDPFGYEYYEIDVFSCSVCGANFDVSEALNYCPNCGAKMDGGNEDGML